jgi:glycosyltransferase involved in cell wall biosynthesis
MADRKSPGKPTKGDARDDVPAVSVLLPCRDAEPFLGDCRCSLQAQTESDFEVVAVNDVSTDGTPAFLGQWAADDPRVRVVQGAGEGLVAALSLAADHARAPLLARMDADDVAHPGRLELQRRFLERRPDLAGCGTGVRYFPRRMLGSGYRRYERWINALHQPSSVLRDLFVECPIAHPTLMLRAMAFRAVGGYRERGWPEDYDLVLRLHRRGMQMANVPRVLVRWRVTPGRLSMTSPNYAPEAFRACKAHHLRDGFLPADRPVVVWGAGRVGKTLALALLEERVKPAAFVELDPRKIGQTIHDAEVIRPLDLEAWEPRPYVLLGVGSPGARAEIREALEGMGYTELDDYRAMA